MKNFVRLDGNASIPSGRTSSAGGRQAFGLFNLGFGISDCGLIGE
jgi:hypothetical protein